MGDQTGCLKNRMGQEFSTIPYVVHHDVHVHTMSDAIKYMIRQGYEQEPGIRPGDIFCNNDPVIGDVHTADVATFVPIFHEGELVGWAAGVTHQVDIGASVQGHDPVQTQNRFEDGYHVSCEKIGENDQVHKIHRNRSMLAVRTPMFWDLDEKARRSSHVDPGDHPRRRCANRCLSRCADVDPVVKPTALTPDRSKRVRKPRPARDRMRQNERRRIKRRIGPRNSGRISPSGDTHPSHHDNHYKRPDHWSGPHQTVHRSESYPLPPTPEPHPRHHNPHLAHIACDVRGVEQGVTARDQVRSQLLSVGMIQAARARERISVKWAIHFGTATSLSVASGSLHPRVGVDLKQAVVTYPARYKDIIEGGLHDHPSDNH